MKVAFADALGRASLVVLQDSVELFADAVERDGNDQLERIADALGRVVAAPAACVPGIQESVTYIADAGTGRGRRRVSTQVWICELLDRRHAGVRST